MTQTIKRSSPDVLDLDAFYRWLNPELPREQIYNRARLLGQYVEVDEEVWWEFLEMMPPLHFTGMSFALLEAATDDIRIAFFRINERYFAAYVSDNEVIPRGMTGTRDLIAAQEGVI